MLLLCTVSFYSAHNSIRIPILLKLCARVSSSHIRRGEGGEKWVELIVRGSAQQRIRMESYDIQFIRRVPSDGFWISSVVVLCAVSLRTRRVANRVLLQQQPAI